MKRIMFCFLITLLVLPSILAINVEIEKQSSNEVMILDLNEPATFDLLITNKGASDEFMFYTFFSPNIFPKGTTPISVGETKEVSLEIYPPEKLKTGYYEFDYFIRSQDSSESSQKLTVNVMELKDAFEIGSSDVDSESKTLTIYIENKASFNFKNLNTKFSSAFFNFDEEFSLEPYEKKEFVVNLNKEDFKKLMAGFYTLDAKIITKDIETDVQGTIKFIEKDILTTTKKDYGFIINTNIIEKTNEGNVIAQSETVIKKNAISRLFTTFSPEPNSVDRDGFAFYYSWNNQINPGETLEINVKTNWLFPFLIIILVVLVVVLSKQYSKTNLILKKRVHFVKAKGGEFALKISIMVNAKKYVERVTIIDRLPLITKIHERFGGDEPSRVDEKNKKIEWNFEKLEQGERRMLSYIIYSKIGILGKFALPSATAIYEKDGDIKETNSNKAYFMTEQRMKEDGE